MCTPAQTAFRWIFSYECRQTRAFPVVEWSSGTPSLPLPAKRVAVVWQAGEAALACLHALLCNRWKHTHTPTQPLSVSLCDSDALRVHAGALPLRILYIWTCARKLSSFPPALFPQTRPRSESTKAALLRTSPPRSTGKNGLEPLPRQLAGHLWQPKRLQSYGTNARSGKTWEKGSAAGPVKWLMRVGVTASGRLCHVSASDHHGG